MKTIWWTHPERVSMTQELLSQPPIHTGEWQSMDTSGSRMHATHELEDVTIVIPVVPNDESLWKLTDADAPWAEEHFRERVSGHPHNPPPSHVRWPYAVRGNGDHTHDGEFDHTYPERFWPKRAGCDCVIADECTHPTQGIRFAYGDLNDVVELLIRSPMTRQAYLPVWFPEDTGAWAHKGDYDYHQDGDPSPIRVPCTLGYHFMIRNGQLSCRYYLRSCDIYRHLNNDLYLAGRLMQWMCAELLQPHDAEVIRPGRLTVHIASLHAFVGDVHRIRREILDA